MTVQSLTQKTLTQKTLTKKTLIKKVPLKTTMVEDDIFYPDTDGEPMAESDFQAEYLMYLVQTLRLYFSDHHNIYVSGNLLIYYEKGEPKSCVAPDVFVVFGVSNHKRRSYKVWEEGKFPDIVIEITSKTTRSQDEGKKVKLYQRLGVKEYFQYDPTSDYLDPPLKGRWLDEDGVYQNMVGEKIASKEIRLESRVLGLYLQIKDGELRLYNPTTNTFLPTLAEAKYQADFHEQRASEEEQRANEEEQRASEEERRANEEEQRANEEKSRADSAEAELKALKVRLKALGIT